MTYENWKVSKADYQESEELQEEYSKVAEWCNNSQQYQIQEVGDEYCVVEVSEPLPPTNEQISQQRQNAYAERTDPLTLRKLRKQALGEWTTEDEKEYVAQIQAISEQIEAEFPYNSEEPTL